MKPGTKVKIAGWPGIWGEVLGRDSRGYIVAFFRDYITPILWKRVIEPLPRLKPYEPRPKPKDYRLASFHVDELEVISPPPESSLPLPYPGEIVKNRRYQGRLYRVEKVLGDKVLVRNLDTRNGIWISHRTFQKFYREVLPPYEIFPKVPSPTTP